MLKDILIGHINELCNNNDSLSKSRLEICSKCPIVKNTKKFGPICDGEKWINEKDEVSLTPKEGFVRGCYCRLIPKSTIPSAKCVIGKWK